MALAALCSEREFRKVRQHGAVVRHPLFTLRISEYRPRYGERWQPKAIVGIVVAKKTLKRAVDRNRVRRRVREALRTLPGGLSPCRAVLHPTPAVLSAPWPELHQALATALRQGLHKPVKKGEEQRQKQRLPAQSKGQPAGETEAQAAQEAEAKPERRRVRVVSES